MRFPRMIRLSAAAVAAVVVGTLVMPVGAAQAGPEDKKRQVDASIDRVQDDLEDTSADLTGAFVQLQKVEARLPVARAALVRSQSQLVAADARDREIGSELAVARATEAKAVDDLAETARSTIDTTSVLGGIARQAYQTGGMGQLSVALQAQDADEFADRVVMVDTAMKIQGDALAHLDVARAETTAKKARLTAVRQQVAELKVQAEANLAHATELRAQAAAAKAEVESLVRDQQHQVATIESRKAAERKRLDALEAQSRALQRQLAEIARREKVAAARAAARAAAKAKAQAARDRRRSSRSSTAHRANSGAPHSSSSSSGGYLSAPVSGGWISSEFGRRFHPILHYWRLHAGMDYAVGCGTPVHAAADGSIVSAGWGGGYGNRIVVSHGVHNGVGLATTYNHLSRIVQQSGHVSRGQLIGYSGTTGSSTGCHLHFETYDDGIPVNPRRWL